jgi:hypothetical protein
MMYEGRGRLNEQLSLLAEDRQLPARQFELGLVERQMHDSIERWQVLALCHGVLERMRAVYETERQPETLREASEYLARMTGGQYRRVWTPLTENVLFVEDAAGKSLPVEVLSRGSREQLFLCLRLALCSLYARRGADLPLVLDDVLVNFDAQRTKAAAAVLRDFAASGRQVLVFTCHEHIFKQFKSFKAAVRTLPDNANSRGTIVSAPAAEMEVEEEPAPSLDKPAAAAVPRPSRGRPKSRPAASAPAPVAAQAVAAELPARTPVPGQAASPAIRPPEWDSPPFIARRPLFDGAIWHDSDDERHSDLMLYDREPDELETSDEGRPRPVLGISIADEDDEAELDSVDDDQYDNDRLSLAEDDVEAA